MEVLIAGDFVLQNRPLRLLESGDYSFLDPIREITADYKVLNFESSLTDGDYPPIKKKGIAIKSPSSSVIALKYADVSCVTLANNHFMDYGKPGYEDSVRLFSQAGIDFVGAGHNLEEATRPLIKRIGAYDIAIINCCEHEFSIATDDNPGCNPLNIIPLYNQIKELRGKVNYVFMIIHGGFEHFPYPSPRMIDTYRFFIDAGADCVINHHQHCFCGYELYNGKPIFYGLGNLIFDSSFKEKNSFYEGYMVRFSIDEGISFELIPYYQCKEDVIFRLLNKSEQGSFGSRIGALNSVLLNREDYDLIIREYKQSHVYKNNIVLTPYVTRIGKSLYQRHLLPGLFKGPRAMSLYNNVMCESHLERLQWLLEYTLGKN